MMYAHPKKLLPNRLVAYLIRANMRAWAATTSIAVIVALLAATAQAIPQSTTLAGTANATSKGKASKKTTHKRVAVYTGNAGVRTSRRLTAKEKAAILAGKMFPPTTEIVCPPDVNMRTFNPNADYPGRDFGSFLAMRGGPFGYVTREWLNGCEQRLSFPLTNPKVNAPYGEAQGDYKPTYSPDGKYIAFFRRYSARTDRHHPYNPATDEATPAAWHTRVTVIDADGGDVRYLSDQTQLNSNPMWTRKRFRDPITGRMGYRVTWSRLYASRASAEGLTWTPASTIPAREEGCWNDVGQRSTIGRARCWTDNHQLYFAYSSLKDGRILVRKELTNQLFLVTPNDRNPNRSRYDRITFTDPSAQPGPTIYLHKMSISQDETKITYMKVDPASPTEWAFPGGYSDARLAYADFDAKTGTISHEVIFTKFDLRHVTWYPQFTKHNRQIVFACSGQCPIGNGKQNETSTGQIYAYDLKSRRFTRISHHQRDNHVNAKSQFRQIGNEYRYPNIWGVVK